MDAQWRCAGSAAATRRECGDAQVRDDSSSASRRAKQNDASAPPCPARPSRACLASRTNHVPAVTRVGGRGDGAAVDDGPLCRRRADAAALSSRGRDLGGRGPMRRVLRQADGGRAQTSLSWLADTLLSQDRAAPIRFCRPTVPLTLTHASRNRSPATANSPGGGIPGDSRGHGLARGETTSRLNRTSKTSTPMPTVLTTHVKHPRRHPPPFASSAGPSPPRRLIFRRQRPRRGCRRTALRLQLTRSLSSFVGGPAVRSLLGIRRLQFGQFEL